MTKDQAIVKAEEYNREQRNKFCPLIKDYCKEDCVCFREARVYTGVYPPNTPEEERYACASAYCASPMIDYALITDAIPS